MKFKGSKAATLDYILMMCDELKSPPMDELYEFVDVDYFYLGYLCEYLEGKGMVTLIAISTKRGGSVGEYMIKVTNKGRSFYRVLGGFKRQRYFDILNEVWKFVKIGAGFVNGAAVIYISFLTYDYQRQKDLKDDSVKKEEIRKNNYALKVKQLDSMLRDSNKKIIVLSDSLHRKQVAEPLKIKSAKL